MRAFVCAVLLLSSIAVAGDPPPKTVVKVYDVTDLLLRADPSPAAAEILSSQLIGGIRRERESFARSARSVFSTGPAPVPDEDESLELINVIQGIVEPDSWNNDGFGRIQRFQLTSFAIRQTAENHRKIEALFEGLRAARRPALVIRAQWFLCSQEEMRRHTSVVKLPDGSSGVAVDRDGLEKLRPADFSGQTSAANGRAVHIASGQVRKVSINVRSNVGPKNAVGYDPVIVTLQDGVSLDLTPALSPDGRSVSLEVFSVVSDWTAGFADTLPAVLKPSDVERVNLHVHRLRATATLPLGRPMLVGALTLRPKTGAGADARVMHLVIEAVTAKP